MRHGIFRRIAAVLPVCIALGACGETGGQFYDRIHVNDYPQATGPGETLFPGEEDAARRVAAIIEAHLTRLSPNGPVLRDAHPKATGCVDALFTVNHDVPAAYRFGIFRTPGASYRAIIRFSNSNEDATRPDAKPDGRGMAIKLFDLQPGQTPITTDPLASLAVQAARGAGGGTAPPGNMALAAAPAQDFIMISHPTFLAADPEGYRLALQYSDSDNRLAELFAPVAALRGLGPAGIKSAGEITSLTIDNPLATRYWSMVPYQLGPSLAMKFSAVFVPGDDLDGPVDKSDPDFLRYAMARTLARRDAHFIFEVQPVDPSQDKQLSVEDSRYEWPEQTAPFHPVARIDIPKQEFDTTPRNAACALLSYSPWHALPEHKPLGAVNRMRKPIYEAVSAFRRQ